jgi:uncharacterized protein
MTDKPDYQEVTYYSDGLKIAAFLYRPVGADPTLPIPAIVLVHGYSGMKTVFGNLPTQLRDAGYAVLAIDNRGYNLSEGARQRSNPIEHTQDVIDAVTFLETLPEIDRKRIGIYGTSWGGGIAIQAAALDPRIKVIVTCVAVSDGERWMRESRREWEWPEFQDRVAAAARHRVTTGDVERIELSDLMVSDPHSKKVSGALAQAHPLFSSSYEIQSAEWCSRWHPIWLAPHIAPRPVLTIYAENDRLAPPRQQIDLHEACGEPKELVMLPEAEHYDSYDVANPPVATVALEASLKWYAEHL